MIRRSGRCTSVKERTRTGGRSAGRKPKNRASEESPSKIRIAPFSILSGQSAFPGVPGRATNIRAIDAGLLKKPTDERIAGQAPGLSDSTVKYGMSAAMSGHANKKLTAKRIPESHSNIVERRCARAIVHQLPPAQCTEGQIRRPAEGNAHSWP